VALNPLKKKYRRRGKTTPRRSCSGVIQPLIKRLTTRP
jgi:hypothetical protein